MSDRAAELCRQLRNIHRREFDGQQVWCESCGRGYPCPTVAILDKFDHPPDSSERVEAAARVLGHVPVPQPPDLHANLRTEVRRCHLHGGTIRDESGPDTCYCGVFVSQPPYRWDKDGLYHICELGEEHQECDLTPGVVCLAHYNAAAKKPDRSAMVEAVYNILSSGRSFPTEGLRAEAERIVARLYGQVSS